MMSNEHWKALTDYPGYEVSDLGNVRHDMRYWANSRALRPFLRPPNAERGYLAVRLRGLDGRRHDLYVHVLVAEAFLGPRTAGKVVHHGKGGKFDNSASNLEYATYSENARGKVAPILKRLTPTATTTATRLKIAPPKCLESYF